MCCNHGCADHAVSPPHIYRVPDESCVPMSSYLPTRFSTPRPLSGNDRAQMNAELDNILQRQRAIAEGMWQDARELAEAQAIVHQQFRDLHMRMRPAHHPKARTKLEYDALWTNLLELAPALQILTYETFPWPVAVGRPQKEDLCALTIGEFLFEGVEAVYEMERKVVVREMERWKPETFTEKLAFVIDEDRERVRRVGAIVARRLHEMLQI